MTFYRTFSTDKNNITATSFCHRKAIYLPMLELPTIS